MARTHRVSTTATLIVCLVGSPWGGTLFATEEVRSSSDASASPSISNGALETQEATSTAAAITADPAAMEKDPLSGFTSDVSRSPFTLTDVRLTADAPKGAATAQAWRGAFNFVPVESGAFAQRGGYGGRGSGGGRNGAVAALLIGATASIAGAAILIYANRPECSTTNQMASGCGYGTRVIGGAVLTGGIVALAIGALTWR
jgi:hypothetical protein